MAVSTLLVFVFMCVAGQGSGNGDCPRKFDFRFEKGRETQTPSVFVPSCYLVSTAQKTWLGAKQHCTCLGADLISIETDQEQAHILAVFRNNSALQRPRLVPFRDWGLWTSGNDLEKGNSWHWATKKRISRMDPRWHGNNPGNNDEHCMVMIPKDNLKWHDIKCSNEFISYICEVDAKH